MVEDERGYGAGSALFAFFLGGLVGAGVALLFAPKPGSETRQMIKVYAGETKGKAEAYMEKVKERATSILEKGKEFVEEQKIIITSAIETGKETYEKEKEKLTTERKA